MWLVADGKRRLSEFNAAGPETVRIAAVLYCTLRATVACDRVAYAHCLCHDMADDADYVFCQQMSVSVHYLQGG